MTKVEDSTLFIVEAIGNIGQPATEALPLLRSKLGTGPELLDAEIQSAIGKLEPYLNNDLPHRPSQANSKN